MQPYFGGRWLLVCLLLFSACFLITFARRGGGGSRGSSRGSSSRGSSSRPSPSYSRPSPSHSRPSPSYSRPSPSYSKPSPSYSKPAPAPAFRPAVQPPAVSKPAFARQPAYNPSYQPDRQPSYNPNFKPDNNKPVGPPPPYSPSGHPVPNVPVGPPPAYQGKPPTGAQLPPYPGPAVRPPAYPGLSPNPAQPGHFPNQQGVNRPYPVQPGYQGGFYQPNVNRPYPVQPGFHTGMNRPNSPQSLGGNVWQPHYGMPAPAYMNYGGIPTGTNMYTKPHKKKGFIGSLMSMGNSNKNNKYYGSYPSPYGIRNVGGIGTNPMGGGFLGKHGSSASMYTIFPYMAAKSVHKIHKSRFGYMPMFLPSGHWHHYHHHHYNHGHSQGLNSAEYYDVYNDDYIGKCQKPIKKKHSEIKCNSSFDALECNASCEEGYKFPDSAEQVKNKCWHITGVWRPKKNFPDCKPVCTNECKNGGECIRPGVCKCPAEFRGDRCQLSFLKCDIRSITKEGGVGWVCTHHRNETICKITCKEPARFESPPASEYRCTPEGVWTPDTVPQCIVKDTPAMEKIIMDSIKEKVIHEN